MKTTESISTDLTNGRKYTPAYTLTVKKKENV